VHGGYKG